MGWSHVSQDSGSNRQDIYVKIEPGKPKRVHALLEKAEEPISYWTHWINSAKTSVKCPGKAVCPACHAQIPATMKHAINVWDYVEKKVKILERGNTVFEPIKTYYEMNNNSLDGVDLVIKQTGEGKASKYVVGSIQITEQPPKEAMTQRYDLAEICVKTPVEEIERLIGKVEFEVDEPQEAHSISEITMPTGKYKGKTLIEIAKLDGAYVQWVADNFEDGEVKDAAIEALESVDTKMASSKSTPKASSKKDGMIKHAMDLVKSYQDKGGDLKAVAAIMRDVAKKTLIKDFTEDELERFTGDLEDLIESLAFETPA